MSMKKRIDSILKSLTGNDEYITALTYISRLFGYVGKLEGRVDMLEKRLEELEERANHPYTGIPDNNDNPNGVTTSWFPG